MKKLKVRACYGHLGGTLGNRLFERMKELGWFVQEPDNQSSFELSEIGIRAFESLGVDIHKKR